MTDTQQPQHAPSFLDRVRTWVHGEFDSHKPLFLEAVERIHNLEQWAASREQKAAEAEKAAADRFAKIEAHIAVLLKKDTPVVEHTAEQVAKDAAPVVGEAVHDAAATVADVKKAAGA